LKDFNKQKTKETGWRVITTVWERVDYAFCWTRVPAVLTPIITNIPTPKQMMAVKGASS